MIDLAFVLLAFYLLVGVATGAVISTFMVYDMIKHWNNTVIDGFFSVLSYLFSVLLTGVICAIIWPVALYIMITKGE